MSRAAIFAWLQRQFITRHMKIFNCCLFLLFGRKLINGFYYRSFHLGQLIGCQLQLDIDHCQLAHKNGTLQASQGYNQCTKSSRSDHQCGYVAPQSSRINCDRSKLVIHIKVLVFAMLLSKNQKKTIYSLLSLNKWLHQEIKQHNGSVPQRICQLKAR